MSATYRLIGSRYLRKYTAEQKTAVYNAAADASRIVSELCRVPWEAVDPANAELPTHGDDKNAENRDLFDAALFCCEHGDNLHRAYANVAVYRYAVPSAAQGKTLESLAAKVTCDPYNANGARLHLFTNDTGEIPMDCHALRGEGSDGVVVEDGTTAAGVAPRTVKAVNGQDYWYPTTATATLAPTAGLTLGKFLFLVVALESYATTRGNWLEGAAIIENRVSVTLSEAVDGWNDGGSEDLRGGTATVVLEGGAQPTWLQPLSVRAAETTTRQTLWALHNFSPTPVSFTTTSGTTRYTSLVALVGVMAYDDATGEPAATFTGPVFSSTTSSNVTTTTVSTQKNLSGKRAVYAYVLAPIFDSDSDPGRKVFCNNALFGVITEDVIKKFLTLLDPSRTYSSGTGASLPIVSSGAAGPLGNDSVINGVEYAGDYTPYMISVSAKIVDGNTTYNPSSAGAYVFYENEDGELLLCSLNATGDGGQAEWYTASPDVTSAINFGKIPPLDASSLVRTGTALDECLADLSWQIATVDAATGARTAADTFAALLARLGEAAGRVAQDYAPAGGTFPHADLDAVTVVPRFERAAAATASYDSLPQPGISLWFAKTESAFSKKARVGTKESGKVVPCAVSPSFLQGAYLAVRANKAGSRLVLTATGAVANTGLALKIAAWRSKGAAWYGAQGFYTASTLGRVSGFADASAASFTAPKFERLADDSAGDGATAGGYVSMAAYGGVEVELLGTSAEIAGALASGDSVEIALSADVAEGDAIILAPVPVAFTGSDEGGAYFGRQSAPSATTAAKGWARSSADLGWFPKIEIY